MRKAQVYVAGEHAAELIEDDDGQFQMEYLSSYSGEDISWTLNRDQKSFHAKLLFPFFDGLIPEGWMLNLAVKNWKLDQRDRMGLLLATCQDCIGDTEIRIVRSASPPETQNPKSYRLSFETKRCLATYTPVEGGEIYTRKALRALFDSDTAPEFSQFEDIEKAASLQLNQHLAVSGVQRKMSMHLDSINSRITWVGFEGQYILKPPSDDYPEMPELEHASMQLAARCGFDVPPNALVPLVDGKLAYLIRRIDRKKYQKFHMEDLAQLSEFMTERKYNSSLEKSAKTIARYSQVKGDDLLKFFEINVFCFLIGNSDMHLKNFSMWKDPQTGLRKLTPFYDLLPTQLLIEDPEQTALAINGKKNKITRTDFIAFAETLKIPKKVWQQVLDKVPDWSNRAQGLIEKEAFLTEKTQKKWLKHIQEKTSLLSQ